MTLNSLSEIRAVLVRTSSELLELNYQEFYNWQASKLGNDLFISDPERANRIYNAAEFGADGSTHAERIDDFQEFADEHYSRLSSALARLSTDSEVESEIEAFERECSEMEAEMDAAKGALDSDIDALANCAGSKC